jgi:N-acetylglucosaminyldiphosphoundecaprenol N-acetyl-beta-D-mannosaminyltransferase
VCAEHVGVTTVNAPVRQLFGVPINAMTMERVLSLVDETIESRGRLLIGVVNAAKLVNMRTDEALRRAVLSADVVFADGTAVVWASRILGKRLPERIAGIDLMHEMLRRGDERNYRVYCLGASDETLQRAVRRIEFDYPGVVICGMHNGYFGPEEERDVVADIRASQPDILFVAMSPPKKEIFLARRSAELGVPVCHGVGGAFDILAGTVQRAPRSWQRLGLEWLYRVKQEPRRLWRRYLVTNTLFAGMVLAELLRRSGGSC